MRRVHVKWRVAIVGFGPAFAQIGHAFAQANTLGAMAIGSTADLVDTSSWITLGLWIFAGLAVLGGLYHAIMHRNGRSNVPLAGVALMFLLSGAALGAGFIMSATARSITGAAPGINQATAVQPFAVAQ